MTAFVYLPGKSPALAERWLETEAEAGQGPVCLIAEPAYAELANAIRRRFPSVADVWMLPEQTDALPPSPDPRVAAAGHTKVVLPVSFNVTPMHFIEGTHIPEISSYYPVFRHLWRLGFREFQTYTLSGNRVFRIPHFLEAFRNRHLGRRCFVAGNGPSLNAIDMSRLKTETVFGANRCYLGFEQWGFGFPYWGITDWLQIEEYGAEYERRVPPETTVFFPFDYLPWLRFANGCPVDFQYWNHPRFSDTGERLAMGHTVIYTLLQIAAAMGCDPIILIGVDHRYHLRPAPVWRRAMRAARDRLVAPLRGTPLYKGVRAWRQARTEARSGSTVQPRVYWEAVDADGPTHFDERYADSGGRRFLLPKPDEAKREFREAARWARKKGVRILNATPDSALREFPCVAYDDLF